MKAAAFESYPEINEFVNKLVIFFFFVINEIIYFDPIQIYISFQKSRTTFEFLILPVPQMEIKTKLFNKFKEFWKITGVREFWIFRAIKVLLIFIKIL